MKNTDLPEYEKLKMILNVGENGYWDWNLDTNNIFFNNRYFQMLGYKPDELPMKVNTWVNLLHPEDRKELAEKLIKKVHNAEPFETEFRLKCKNGNWKWILGKGKSFEIDENGIPHRAVGIHVDIDNLKGKEERITHLNQVLKALKSINKLIISAETGEELIKKACDILVKTRGYNDAWIILFDESTKFYTSYSANSKIGFDRVINMINKGNIPQKMKKAIDDNKYLIIEDSKKCDDCPLSKENSGYSAFTSPLYYDGNFFGLLSITLSNKFINDKEEQDLFNEISDDISFALNNLKLKEEKNIIEAALIHSEKKVQEKFKELLTQKDSEIQNIELEDVIDSETIQLMTSFLYEASGIPIGIIDNKGKILVGNGWQEICTKFHRANPESNKNCIDSDFYLSKGLNKGEYKAYKCKNNLWDIATPIVIGNKRLGNIFLGQFFYKDEKIDRDLFKMQAKTYGFEEKKYLEALEKIPRFSKDFVENVMKFYSLFSNMIANIGYGNLKLAKSLYKNEEIQTELKRTRNTFIETVSKIVDTSDPYTYGHQYQVSILAEAIAKEMNLSGEKIEEIKLSSMIHDIGKIGIPSEVLNKPTKLSEIEWSLIKNHTQQGFNILDSVEFSFPIAEIVLQHHEKIDGSGYPQGLKEKEIHLESKIITVADVVEAMTHHRPYRPALGLDKAFEEIKKNSGKLYDEKVVEACLEVFRKGFSF